MKAVAAELGASVLREVDEEKFYAAIPSLRKTVGDRAILRAIHFFKDNRIVDEEVSALKSGDFEAFKRLVIASGRSSATNLQNVFAVVNPQEQGLSLALALIERLLEGRGAYRSICSRSSGRRSKPSSARARATCSPSAAQAARRSRSKSRF